MKKPQRIGSILETTLKGLEVDGQIRAYSLWGAWKEIVGEPIAQQAQPQAIRNGILFVTVSHSTWVQQLQFLKTMLLDKINTYFGEPLIKDMRFRLGKTPSSLTSAAKTEAWQKENLDDATLKRIENLLRNVPDEETKKAIREVFIKGAKVDRHRKK
jgi:predicted nucleic acid-binding Zn ribbon protein